MSTTRYRLILSVFGMAFAALVAATVLLTPNGANVALPASLESFSPADGAIIQRQSEIHVDLAAGYILTMKIDGTPIPQSNFTYTQATANYVFRPSPEMVITQWTPGFHFVEISWDRAVGLPDPKSLRWSFRTQ